MGGHEWLRPRVERIVQRMEEMGLTWADLINLVPGLGPARAKAIMAYELSPTDQGMAGGFMRALDCSHEWLAGFTDDPKGTVKSGTSTELPGPPRLEGWEGFFVWLTDPRRYGQPAPRSFEDPARGTTVLTDMLPPAWMVAFEDAEDDGEALRALYGLTPIEVQTLCRWIVNRSRRKQGPGLVVAPDSPKVVDLQEAKRRRM